MDISKIPHKNTFSLKLILGLLIAIFAVLIGYIFVPTDMSNKRAAFPFIAILALVFFILGIALILFTRKLAVKGPLKKYLLLTGAGAAGILPSTILHNLVYGLFIFVFGHDFWERAGSTDEPLFFLLAIIACPLLFLFGALGSIIFFVREPKGR